MGFLSKLGGTVLDYGNRAVDYFSNSPAAGSAFGAMASVGAKIGQSAFDLYQNKSLMKYANTQQQRNWVDSLTLGPTLMRQGLQAAGYNPLLAIGGMDVGSIGNVGTSAMSHTANDNIGNDLISNYQKLRDSRIKKAQEKVVENEPKIQEKQIENLDADIRRKNAETLQTELETQLAPWKTTAAMVGSAAGAGALLKSLHSKKPYLSRRPKHLSNVIRSSSSQSKNVFGVLGTLGKLGAIGATSALGANYIYNKNREFNRRGFSLTPSGKLFKLK